MSCIIKSLEFNDYYLKEYKSFRQVWTKVKNNALILDINEAAQIQVKINQKSEIITNK